MGTCLRLDDGAWGKAIRGKIGYAVYLVDPGSDSPGVLRLIQEVNGLTTEAAAEYLQRFPSLISCFEHEGPAQNLAARFRDFDAVAIVRPADEPPGAAPVEDAPAAPAHSLIRWILAALAVVQIALSAYWLWEGRLASGFFGLALVACLLLYLALARR